MSLCCVPQGGRGLHQGGGEATTVERATTEGVAAIRVPGEFAGCARRGHHLCVRNPAVHRDLLPGDAAGIQALQGVQHHPQRHQDRGGRGA